MDNEVFEAEQAHLSETYGKLEGIERDLRARLEADLAEALADKEDLFDEMTRDFSGDIQLETLAELEAMNRIIEGYNLSADINEEKLRRAQLLLRAPYFAKVRLRFAAGGSGTGGAGSSGAGGSFTGEPKDIYIGAAGMTDDKRRHFIVDWRSPVAEVYYNQANGRTSYSANGRTIEVDLELRRQFDLRRDKLNAYFDTTVAIEDPLLLQTLSKRRSARLEAITTTIQREQNQVIRHEDVPVLLVHGIAGSGKTSVLLQRIAYLFYTERDNLRPDDVFLLTPNPVFGRYIDNVLPDMGERNPQILTWDALMNRLGLGGRGVSKNADITELERIDRALAAAGAGGSHASGSRADSAGGTGGAGTFTLEPADFCDVKVPGPTGAPERVIAASSVRASVEKFAYLPLGPHRCTLAIEDMMEKVEQRILRLSKDPDEQDRLLELSTEEQIAVFGQQVLPIGDDEIVERTRQWLEARYAGVERQLEDGTWLRLDRVGRRLLGKETLDAAEWLYLRLALVGGGERHARYVMVDEVQDYTSSQLAVLARQFPNAHFLLLGDENQAVREGTATFAEIRALFERLRGDAGEGGGVGGHASGAGAEMGPVSECALMISYRSSPEITDLFCKLLPPAQQVEASSVQRPGTAPVIVECASDAEYTQALRQAVEEAAGGAGEAAGGAGEADAGRDLHDDAGRDLHEPQGLTALIANSRTRAKQLARLLADTPLQVVGEDGELPDSGVVLLDVKLAKGLEFDHVIVPDVHEGAFPDEPVRRHRLYTAISRATERVTLIANGPLCDLLR